jgi:hypothetical protein
MTFENLQERFRAIEKLQSIRDCPATSVATSAEVDYAIDLALSPLRKVDKYFLRNLLRDARRILNRKQLRVEALMVSLDSALPGFDYDGTELTLHDVLPSSSATPALFRQMAEFNERVGQLVRGNPPARALIEGLQRGESVAEAAHSAGISISYAKKLRRAAREKLASTTLN